MAGRNKKYTTDMLKMIVRQFRQEDTKNKITVSRLINYSGIPKDVWYRNKEILDYIKQANFAPLLIKTEAAEIPSGHDIIKACGDDVEKYKEFIHSLLDTVASQEREIIRLRKDSEGIAKSEIEVCVEIFFVRGSKMVGREHYFFPDLKEMEDKEIISGFIKQYYLDNQNLPNKIMVREELEDKEAIEEWLTKEAGRKVEIKSPKKGEKLRFVEMADNNAKITLDNKERDKSEILVELKEVLGLDKLPRKIETYDISNISGEYIVAGMCVMADGVIKRNLSRRFKIKTVYGQDDPRCMEEVITRRLKHSIDSDSSGFGRLPDAIFADGGITQIRATKTAIAKYELNIPVFGMVKNDKHQTRALMDENRNELEISENLKNLITKFQDEVHDTAISYHRKLRDSDITKSDLDEIEGIGEVKKKALLKHFGSVEKIKKSNLEDLAKVKGINESFAKKILEELNK